MRDFGCALFYFGEMLLKNYTDKSERNYIDMYRQMYHKLFNSVTDVIDICEDEKCVRILKNALRDAEWIYVTYYE